ncbi:phage tail sheath family protein [Streptomyces sp. NPDC051555]|uniref:phage tail sheath family protein n=1 Tax=Streptomyces sp. NPDC051555 TaxID=3365657 RepID=UPI0037B3B1CD
MTSQTPGVTITERPSGSHPVTPTGTSTAAFLCYPLPLTKIAGTERIISPGDLSRRESNMQDVADALTAFQAAPKNGNGSKGEELNAAITAASSKKSFAENANTKDLINSLKKPTSYRKMEDSETTAITKAITAALGKDAANKTALTELREKINTYNSAPAAEKFTNVKGALNTLDPAHNLPVETVDAIRIVKAALANSVAYTIDESKLSSSLASLTWPPPWSYQNLIVSGFFENGGSDAVVAYAATLDDALKELEKVPDVQIVVDATGTAAMKSANSVTAILEHCAKMNNRVAVLSLCEAPKTDDFSWYPQTQAGRNGNYCAFYWPWVKAAGGVPVPPTGHMAGVWARVDGERGVFKAPANVALSGVTGLAWGAVSANDQVWWRENAVDRGGNELREVSGRGVVVWGARTAASDSDKPDWGFVNVRRLVCFLEDSIMNSTGWAVFEPNDERLWSSLRREIGAFLTSQWRHGALKGATAAEAFYVQCDQTNQDSSQPGTVFCNIGIAPVRPAEFVQISVQQLTAG